MGKENDQKEKYKYELLCSADMMDNIKKRTKWKTQTSSILLFLIVFFSLIYYRKPELISSAKIQNITVSKAIIVDKTQSFIYTFTTLSLWIFAHLVGSIIHRICLLVEEFGHKKTRYNNSFLKLIRSVFDGGWNYSIYLIGTVIIIMCCIIEIQIVKDSFLSSVYTLIIFSMLYCMYLSFKSWTQTEFQHSKSHVPSTGTFMAYAAYYSYYKNVLPSLKDRIKKVEKEYQIDIPLKKLVILFPSSGQIPDRLDYGSDEIELVCHLPHIEKDKGGTFRRKMTNPVYKIAPKNKQVHYCVVEGQSSLPVLKSMKQPEDVYKQQAFLLYKMLKEILENSGEKNSFILFDYDDYDDEPLNDKLWKKLDETLNKNENQQ